MYASTRSKNGQRKLENFIFRKLYKNDENKKYVKEVIFMNDLMITKLLGTELFSTRWKNRNTSFCVKNDSLSLHLRMKRNKTADFVTFILAVCRLARYKGKSEETEKNLFLQFQELKGNRDNDL